MEKRISYSQFQSVKCVAKACDPLIVKRNKLKERIESLAIEYKGYDTQINSLQAGIVSVIGFPVEALVKKVIEPGVDCNGQPKKTTKYVPTDIVTYDETHKQYVITTPDAETTDAINTAADECKDPVNTNEVEAPVASDNAEEVVANNAETTEEIPSGDAIFD